MPTTTPLTDAINALTTYANETTGASDTNLSSAVASLVAGYGGGGSGWTTDGIMDATEPNGAITTNATTFPGRVMMGRTGITSLSAPLCTTFGTYAFANCTGITSVSLPKLRSDFGDYALDGCSSLPSITLPQYIGKVRQRVFGNCGSLTIADLGRCYQLNSQAFSGSSALRTLILRNGAVVTLDKWDSNILGGIYANASESTVYVPSALISTYQTTGNWASAYSAGVTFTAIEGSQYENYFLDGTPTPTFTAVTIGTIYTGRTLNDATGGLGTTNSNYWYTDYITTNGHTSWEFGGGSSTFGNLQAFNGDTCLGLVTTEADASIVVNGDSVNARKITLPSNCTKFRFSGSTKAQLDAKSYALYKVTY